MDQDIVIYSHQIPIFEKLCGLCDEHLGNSENAMRAAIALAYLHENSGDVLQGHKSWKILVPPMQKIHPVLKEAVILLREMDLLDTFDQPKLEVKDVVRKCIERKDLPEKGIIYECKAPRAMHQAVAQLTGDF